MKAMRDRIRQLFHEMIAFDGGDPDLIQHFTKVHAFACLIAESEGMNDDDAQVLEAAALVHDIAIPLCNQKYGAHPGHLQEKEGPPLVREMLSRLPFTADEINRICALVGEHHTYAPIDGLDHQILIEADFIVNSFENQHPSETLYHTWRHIFSTPTGKKIYGAMFGLRDESGEGASTI